MIKKRNMAKLSKPNVGEYLIDRLQQLGVRHVFGVPGDYVLGFYSMLESSPIEVVGTTREDAAAFAADAYARINGLGAVCVTYCVGGLSICNPIAGAFAEKSPVVVISGAPGMGERINNPLLHHKVREFTTQRDVFKRLTIAGADLNDPDQAFREIDRVLNAAVRYKRPVYLELPRDRVAVVPSFDHRTSEAGPVTEEAALKEAVGEAIARINASRQPVILAGVEVHRFQLQSLLLKLADASAMPVTTTLLGKSVISEFHPSFAGVYAAGLGKDDVRALVEESDCLVILGAFMTDIDMGFATPTLDPSRCIYATSEQIRMGHHFYHDITFGDFLARLSDENFATIRTGVADRAVTKDRVYPEPPAGDLTQEVDIVYLFQRLQSYLTDKTVVIADIGDALFGSMDLCIHEQTEFLSAAYYTTMGFSVPAALGANLARRDLHPLVIVGDGAFQMTGMELSTILRHRLSPMVVVLNNDGYGTERLLQDGRFNDIPNWEYHRLPELLGGGHGFEVRTRGDLDAALRAADENQNSFNLLNVRLKPDDHSPALERLGRRLGKHVRSP
jgi:TPP-dependent 2-oxoacid decarboxylase